MTIGIDDLALDYFLHNIIKKKLINFQGEVHISRLTENKNGSASCKVLQAVIKETQKWSLSVKYEWKMIKMLRFV